LRYFSLHHSVTRLQTDQTLKNYRLSKIKLSDLEILWHFSVKSDRWAPEVRFIKQDDPEKISDLILTDGETLFILDLNGNVKEQILIQTSPIKKVITIDIVI
jgi:hypothetical protein